MSKVISGKTQNLEKQLYKKLIILTLAALGMAFSVNYFIIPAGILSGGVGGMAQGLSYTITAIYDKGLTFSITMYWVFLILANIPIIIFTYYYYGKKLLYLSVYTFFMSVAFSMFFTFTPGFSNVYLFNLADYGANGGTTAINVTVVVMAILGGIMYGSSVGIVFYQGSTSLGLDPLTRYLGRDKGLNFTATLFTFSIVNSIFWISIIKILEPGQIHVIQDIVFSPEILGSLVFITIYSFVAGRIYPTSKKYLVEINSKKSKEISQKFIDMNYHRGHSIEEVIGGYTKEKREVIKMVINAEEFYDVLKIVNAIDSQAFIYATEAKGTYSSNYWLPVSTLEDKTIKEERLNRKHKK